MENARLEASCGRGWPRCARRARGSSRRATPSAGGSAATSTTARSSGSCALMIELAARARALRRRDGARELRRQRVRQRRGSAVDELRDLAAGHPSRRCSPSAGWTPRSSRWPAARRCRSSSRASSTNGSPRPVETAAYFVVAEALTNVAKYADATHAWVDVAREDGALVDRGRATTARGGADAATGQRPARASGPRRRARRHARGAQPGGRRDARARRLPLATSARRNVEHGQHAPVVLGAVGRRRAWRRCW